MKKTGFYLCLLAVSWLLIGCEAFPLKKPEPVNPALEYMENGKKHETGGELLEARKQYELALTVDPGNMEVKNHLNRVKKKLKQTAQDHYREGYGLNSKGRYAAARKEFLLTLRFWPEHKGAREMLKRNMGYTIHTVKPGETISLLAKKYYNDVKKYKTILEFNKLPENTLLKIGQKIMIPTPTPKTDRHIIHVVKAGDNLSLLAKKYYGDYRKFHMIAKYNRMTDATRLIRGQELLIPEISGVSLAELEQIRDGIRKGRHITHVVKSGDYLSLLAKIYYGDYTKFRIIVSYNNLTDATRLLRGQKILIPEIRGISLTELKKIRESQARQTVKEKAAIPPAKEDEEPPDVTETALPPQEAPVGTVEERREVPPPVQVTPDLPPEIDQVDRYRELGIELFDKKKYMDAITEFDKALNAGPEDPLTREYLSKSHFQYAYKLYENGEFLKAKSNFESARHYGTCDNCAEYIDKCLETYMDIHYNKGISHFGRENLEDAITEWKLVHAIDPDYKDVAANLRKAEKLKEKLDAIKKAQ